MSTASNNRFAMVMAFALMLTTADAISDSANERVLRQEISADGVREVLLQGGNGSADVSVGDDNVIQIQVEVSRENLSDNEPLSSIKSWFLSSAYDDLDELMGALELDTDVSESGKVRVELTPSVSARESRVREKWRITVPKSVAVRLEMADSTMKIEGVAGGTGISLGHGSVDIDVPSGDLDVAVQVGKAQIRTGSQSVGELELESQVGDTELSMNGMKMDYPDPPGPGSRVSLSGNGEDDIDIFVRVGDASLRVNE